LHWYIDGARASVRTIYRLSVFRVIRAQTKGDVDVVTQEAFRKEPVFTELAFSRLLEWLDDGEDSRGERYIEMRRRLVWYFTRRNRPAADELADETLNRIARTLEQSGVILTRPPARYCYVVAKFVLLEDIRRQRKHVHLEEVWSGPGASDRGNSAAESERIAVREQRLDCLDHCLEQLTPEQRELVIEYYRDSRRQKIERRANLASRLGISMNALAIRACRIRETLMNCVEACQARRRHT
jgi:DNA-directed RNA polymerase specialized sigma24 family protein